MSAYPLEECYVNSYKKQQGLVSKLLLPIKQLAWVSQITLQTRSLTCARLLLLRNRKKRYIPGTFRFPFGQVRYVDAGAMLALYLEIFLEHEYEVDGLGPQPFIIDCGANIGMNVIRSKLRYPDARVMAFEADPTIAATMEANITALGLTKVEVVRAAVGETNGVVTFVPEGSLGGYVGAAPDGQEGVTVKAVRLSDCINETVDLLKVDIEGSEYRLLHDLCMTGKIAQVRHIICEMHGSSTSQEQVAQLWTDLAQAGFSVTVKNALIDAGLPGPSEPTPFTAVESAKYLLWFYAWRP